MKIEKSNYEGYVWYSDQKNPGIIQGEWEIDIPDSRNPFIIEGHLYDRQNNVSIRIQYVDGHYLLHKKHIEELDFNSINVDRIDFQPSKMPNKITALQFLRYWKEGPADPLCENMTALQPDELVFVGFKMKED